MSAPIERVFFDTAIPIPENIREINRDYHIEMIAEDVPQLIKYHSALIRSQAAMAGVSVRATDTLAQRYNEANSHLDNISKDTSAMVRGIDRLNPGVDRLNIGVDRLNTGVERLNQTAEGILNAIGDLSDVVSEDLHRISEQILEGQKTLQSIEEMLSHPYEKSAAELRDEAGVWLRSGMKNTGCDRTEDWDDAMRLLRTTTENPIGMQDYDGSKLVGCYGNKTGTYPKPKKHFIVHNV